MDDLQFRRTIYADPNCNQDDVKQAAAQDPAKQEFWDDLKQLDVQLKSASKVDVPDGLADRLILRQSIKSHASTRKRTRLHLALAASVAFAFGVSYTMLYQTDAVNLAEHALAHVYEEGGGYALRENGDISLDTVNAQLASLGATLSAKIGRIYYANFCNFDSVRSYHMVFEGENGKVTVFVVPDSENLEHVEHFSDQQMAGESFKSSRASVIMVSDKDKSNDEFKYKLRQSMLFSA